MYKRIENKTTSMANNLLFYVSLGSYLLLMLFFLLLFGGAFTTAITEAKYMFRESADNRAVCCEGTH